MRRTPTRDQGNEMFRHARIEQATGLRIYFADFSPPDRARSVSSRSTCSSAATGSGCAGPAGMSHQSSGVSSVSEVTPLSLQSLPVCGMSSTHPNTYASVPSATRVGLPGKAAHTKPGVHETRDAPDTLGLLVSVAPGIRRVANMPQVLIGVMWCRPAGMSGCSRIQRVPVAAAHPRAECAVTTKLWLAAFGSTEEQMNPVSRRSHCHQGG